MPGMKNCEIEHKFLVHKEKWFALEKPEGTEYLQGYLSIDPDKVVRVRVSGEKGFLTIKGKSETPAHPEFEYTIPVEDARALLELFTTTRVEKTRTRIISGDHSWDVDEFHGENEGLIVAEIELESEAEHFDLPEWVGEEVTADRRYYNAYLSLHPYRSWGG